MKGHQAQQHPHPHHELSELRLQIWGGGGSPSAHSLLVAEGLTLTWPLQ